MAVLNLILDVDSDVHPELHAALAALVSEGSRGERLRQLAATGLIWEQVRVRGPAATGVSVPVAAAPELQPAPADAMPVAQAAVPMAPSFVIAPPVAMPRPAARVEPTPRPMAKPAPARPAARPDFVDLAIDAPPLSPHPLPELFDIVEAEAPPRPRPAAPKSRARPPAPPAVALPAEPRRGPTAPPPELVDEVLDETVALAEAMADSLAEALADAGPAVAPIAQRPQAKSRLLKMKERGLFKNG